MTADALFETDGGGRFSPTVAATGPWDRGLVHGAALAALFANRLRRDDRTLGRLVVDLSAPVPMAPLTLALSELDGGRRVQRQQATLAAGDRVVASASALHVRTAELDLPASAADGPSPFAGAGAAPEHPAATAEYLGWDGFDTLAVAVDGVTVDGDSRPHQRLALRVPVVEGTVLHGTEVAAVAADYAQTATHLAVPFEQWSFRNADLTIHLGRAPDPRWVGVRSEALVQPVGAGFCAADLYDEAGRVGRSAGTVVVEPRR